MLNYTMKRDELGRNTGGYLARGSIVLIEGVPTGGKSIFAQRIAYGLLENGHTVSYISTELNLIGFVKQMESLNYPSSNYIINSDLLFISLLPQMGNTLLKKNMFTELLTSKRIYEKDCVIIDLVDDFMIDRDIDAETCFKISKMLKRISAIGKTTIMCIDPAQVSPKFLDIMRSISDCYFTMEAKMVLGNMLRIINIQRYKMAIGEINLIVPFRVIPGTGMSVEIASLS